MIHKYRIDFELAMSQGIHPYDKEGLIVEAHTAADAIVQASFQLDEIVRRFAHYAGDKWRIAKIAPVPEPEVEQYDGRPMCIVRGCEELVASAEAFSVYCSAHEPGKEPKR